MQRVSLPVILCAFLSISLASCCNPCKERAEARKAAAEARYGAGSPGTVPAPAPAQPGPPQPTVPTPAPSTANW